MKALKSKLAEEMLNNTETSKQIRKYLNNPEKYNKIVHNGKEYTIKEVKPPKMD